MPYFFKLLYDQIQDVKQQTKNENASGSVDGGKYIPVWYALFIMDTSVSAKWYGLGSGLGSSWIRKNSFPPKTNAVFVFNALKWIEWRIISVKRT